MSGGFSSGIGSGIDALHGNAAYQILGRGIGGGFGAVIGGGNFFQGFGQGIVVGAFNHALHSSANSLFETDPPGIERMIKERMKMSKEERHLSIEEQAILWEIAGPMIAAQFIPGPFDDIAILRFAAKIGGGNWKTINQVHKLIVKGKAPKIIIRADKGKVFGELDHVHFKGGHALNRNGSWKHGGKVLTNKEINFLNKVGWILPN